MKTLITITFLICSSLLYGQINNTQKVQLNKTANTSRVDLEGNYTIFPINGGTISATPISIPGPNNTPIALEHFNSGVRLFSNSPSGNATIQGCSFISFINDQLKVRVKHTVIPNQDHPVYIGAWFYDASGKALNVGYIPQKVSSRTTTDFIMKFNSFPIQTSYLEVKVLQDGKIISKKAFKASYQWNKIEKTYQMDLSKYKSNRPVMVTKNISKLVPDLSLTALKITDKNGSLVDFGSTCLTGKKIIFINNTGNKKSAPYQVLVSYYHKVGNKSVYTELKKITKPPLLPGKQTSCHLELPDDINNIQINIVFHQGNGGETNYNNNSLSKQCKKLR